MKWLSQKRTFLGKCPWWSPVLIKSQSNVMKGTTKLHFTHYLCVVIIFINTGLYKSAFFTDSFGKLAFCFYTLFALCRIRCNFRKLHNICIIIVYILSGCQVLTFCFCSQLFLRRAIA